MDLQHGPPDDLRRRTATSSPTRAIPNGSHYDNVPFPKHIEINRPRDEYAMVLDIVKMDINKGVPDDQFVLEQPEGTTLQTVGQPASAR